VKIRGLKQQHEKIQHQLQERVSSLEKQLKNARKGVPTRPSQQVRELENQIEELRNFYNKKIKDMKKRLEDVPKGSTESKTELVKPVKNEENELKIASLHTKLGLLQNRYDEALKTIESLQSTPVPSTPVVEQKRTPVTRRKFEMTQATSITPMKRRPELMLPQLLQPTNLHPVVMHSQGAQTEESKKQEQSATMQRIQQFIQTTSQQLQESTLAKDLGAQLEYERANSALLEKKIMELEFELNVLKTQPRFMKFQKLTESIARLEKRSAEREQEFNKARNDLKAQIFLKRDLELQRLKDTIKVKDAEIERLYQEIEKLMLKVKTLALSISKEISI